MAAVEVHDLVVRYGPVTAVDHLTWEAETGAVTVVVGPNGAGKTSTIEVLEGLRRPSAGRARVLGLDPLVDHRALAPRMGVMLQDGGVHHGVRPLEALRHAAALYPQARDPAEVLAQVGLARLERRTWRQLSGGEQRRLALGLAIIGRPQVAFLDEPTAGVDPQGRVAIRGLVTELREAGTTVVLCTHDLDEAERLADRVVIIDRGRLVAEGTISQLLAGGGDDEVRFGAAPGLDTDSPRGLAARLGAPVREVSPGEYLVSASGTPTLVAALTAWLAERDLRLADLRTDRRRLEEVFLRLVAEDETGEVDGADDVVARDEGRVNGGEVEAEAEAEVAGESAAGESAGGEMDVPGDGPDGGRPSDEDGSRSGDGSRRGDDGRPGGEA
jgi:ABC-2 type transport system ATP-binding protein